MHPSQPIPFPTQLQSYRQQTVCHPRHLQVQGIHSPSFPSQHYDHILPLQVRTWIHLNLPCYNFSYFALFTYVFSLFLEVNHGAAALTHFSLTHITATLLTHCTAIVLTHSIAILIALPHWCSIYSGQSCKLFFS